MGFERCNLGFEPQQVLRCALDHDHPRRLGPDGLTLVGAVRAVWQQAEKVLCGEGGSPVPCLQQIEAP